LSGAGALALGGEAEGIGLVWPGEEKALGWRGVSEHLPSAYGEVMRKTNPGFLQPCMAGDYGHKVEKGGLTEGAKQWIRLLREIVQSPS